MIVHLFPGDCEDHIYIPDEKERGDSYGNIAQ